LKVNDNLMIKIPFKDEEEEIGKSYLGTAKIIKIDLKEKGIKKIVADFNSYHDSLDLTQELPVPNMEIYRGELYFDVNNGNVTLERMEKGLNLFYKSKARS